MLLLCNKDVKYDYFLYKTSYKCIIEFPCPSIHITSSEEIEFICHISHRSNKVEIETPMPMYIVPIFRVAMSPACLAWSLLHDLTYRQTDRPSMCVVGLQYG